MALTDTQALTTLALAKDDLGITSSDHDTRLEQMILRASQAIAASCNRVFRKASVTEKVRPSDTETLVLAQPPLVSITSVAVDSTTLDADSYEIEDADAGILQRDSGWNARNRDVPGAAGGDIVPRTDKRRITVVYVGGYVLPNDSTGTRNLPYDIEQACILTVTSLFRRRGSDRLVSSESLGDYSVSYRNPNSAIGLGAGGIIPDEAMPLLEPYRRTVML